MPGERRYYVWDFDGRDGACGAEEDVDFLIVQGKIEGLLHVWHNRGHGCNSIGLDVDGGMQ